jgi:hypothetical protein
MESDPGALSPGKEAPMIDLAPGWQISCPHCGRTRPYGKLGIRLGAASIGRRTLAWCSKCHRLRWARVERVPDHEPATA